MKNGQLAHFAINADDVDRARAFYQKVFGWKAHAWGPPGFYQLEGAGVQAALQARRSLVAGTRTVGFECTLAVESLDVIEKAVLANDGKILMQRSIIVGVGTLMFFEDPEGNAFGAMQYDANAEVSSAAGATANDASRLDQPCPPPAAISAALAARRVRVL